MKFLPYCKTMYQTVFAPKGLPYMKAEQKCDTLVLNFAHSLGFPYMHLSPEINFHT